MAAHVPCAACSKVDAHSAQNYLTKHISGPPHVVNRNNDIVGPTADGRRAHAQSRKNFVLRPETFRRSNLQLRGYQTHEWRRERDLARSGRREERWGRRLASLLGRARQRPHRGHEPSHPVAQVRIEGLHERRLLHHDDLPQSGEARVLGAAGIRMYYPLELRKSRK